MSIAKYTVVIIEHTAEAFLVRCGYCKGSGHYYGECPFVMEWVNMAKNTA